MSGTYPRMKLNELLTEAVYKSTMSQGHEYSHAWNRIVQGHGSKTDISTIATHPKYAYDYANDILHGRFLKGEKAILTSSWWSYQYAIEVIQERWPEGEPIIFEASGYGILYVTDLNIKYPECKEYVNTILQDTDLITDNDRLYQSFCKQYFSNNSVLMNKWLRYADNMRSL